MVNHSWLNSSWFSALLILPLYFFLSFPTAMVDYSHLSTGNLESSLACDVFSGLGVSNPNSPSEVEFVRDALAPTSFGDLSGSIFTNPSSPLVGNIIEMTESVAIPVPIPVSSGDSSSSDANLEVNLGPVLGAEAQDIFKAAHFFSRKDKDESITERKKNLHLMNFILALGLSIG